jgi:hypothetical protein
MGKLIMLTYRREETPSKIQLPISNPWEVCRARRTTLKTVGGSASQNNADECLVVWMAEFGVIAHEAIEAQLYLSATNNNANYQVT